MLGGDPRMTSAQRSGRRLRRRATLRPIAVPGDPGVGWPNGPVVEPAPGSAGSLLRAVARSVSRCWAVALGVAVGGERGETSLFYNPGHVLPNGVYFSTVKEHDGPNDTASGLDREDVFRVALGLPVDRYEELFGPRPLRPAKGAVVATGHDFTVLDVVTPHPVYAWMGLVQVLNPSRPVFDEMELLFAEAYRQAVAKFDRSVARTRRKSS